MADGTPVGFGGTGGGGTGGDDSDSFTNTEIEAANGRALGLSAAVAASWNTEVQRATANYNHVLSSGQSLGQGKQGWPRLSKVAKYDNLALGQGARPAVIDNGSPAIAGFSPVGGSTFQPLVARVQDVATGAYIADVDVADLTPGDFADADDEPEGETHLETAVNFARKQWLQYHGIESDTARRFIASACGVGGRSIAALSKGASPNLYKRVTDAIEIAYGLAQAEGKTYRIPAFCWLQGEANNATVKDTYKAALKAYRDDVHADILALTGQSPPPAFITYQTNGVYTSDVASLGVQMAQLECAEEEDNWYLATPSYAFTDRGGHLDANGYRWMGAQIGKVLHKVVTLGQDWKPLSPQRMRWRGREILMEFHVPEPPLVFESCYVGTNASSFPTKGFQPFVGGVAATVSEIAIVGDAVVRIVLADAIDGSPEVRMRYAGSATFSGNGNLRDSDPTVADEDYVYDPASGQLAGANIAAWSMSPIRCGTGASLSTKPLTPADPLTLRSKPNGNDYSRPPGGL
jgi:hypothetical protein